MENNRLFGLDLYRAAAILMVLMANTIFFFQLELPAVSALAPIIGFIGLEIFFVLSGFLLARSLFPIFMADDFGVVAAVRFLRSRLLRIVPLYFFVVLINIGIAAAMGYPIGQSWKYVLFLQNFSGPIPAFFPESWGLPVIVFAVLFFVLLLFGCSKVVPQHFRSRTFPIVALLLLLVFMWTKWIYNTVHVQTDMAQWETTLRTVVLFRIDAVMVGVLAGWLFVNCPVLLQKAKWILAFFGLTGLLFLAVGVGYLQLLIEDFPTFWNVWYLPLTSIILACFLPLLAAWSRQPIGLIAFLSKATFGIYLTHFSIVLLLMEHFMMQDASVGGGMLFLAVGYLVLAVVVGWLAYRIENAVLKRIKP